MTSWPRSSPMSTTRHPPASPRPPSSESKSTAHPGTSASIPTSATSDRHGQVNRHSRSEEHTSELQSRGHLVCRLLLENKKNNNYYTDILQLTRNTYHHISL